MNRIKRIREQLGVTQAAIAKGMGCTQGNVAHYENRDQTVPPAAASRLIAYARSLGHVVTYDDIYGPVAPVIKRARRVAPRKPTQEQPHV